MNTERLTRTLASSLPRARGSVVFSHGAGAGVVGGLRESYTGNARAVYEWFVRHNHLAYWLHASRRKDIALGKSCNFATMSGILAAMRAQVSMGGSNNGAPWPLLSNRTWVVQGWHGTPLKAIGRAWSGSNPRDLEILERPDFYITPSPEYTKRFRQCYLVDSSRFWETGNPRNDVLVEADDAALERRRQELKSQVAGWEDGARIILYAPTWREWLAEVRFLDVPDQDLHRLNQRLREMDARLILRAHHREALAAMEVAREHDRILVSDGLGLPWDVSDWLVVADVLVTDYSSIFYDYLVLDRPIIHLATDIEEYGSRRGFLVDPHEDFAGPVVQTQADLIDAVEEALGDSRLYSATRAILNQTHNPHEDGGSTERVATRMLRLLDGPPRTQP